MAPVQIDDGNDIPLTVADDLIVIHVMEKQLIHPLQ
jgi:hypothetical protein